MEEDSEPPHVSYYYIMFLSVLALNIAAMQILTLDLIRSFLIYELKLRNQPPPPKN